MSRVELFEKIRRDRRDEDASIRELSVKYRGASANSAPSD